MKGKSLLPTIHIHPLLFFFLLLSLFTGTFIQLALILFVVFLHELGHYLAALYFKWRIRKIVLWVFGGIMVTDEYGTRPLHEELIVTLAGPIQHLFIYLVAYLFLSLSILPSPIIYMLLYYNTIVLLFNLLPLWPLDGGKLFFIIKNIFFPYRQAYAYTIVFSLILSGLLILGHVMIQPFNLSSLLIMLFLFIENTRAWQQRFYIFMRFLLHRYELPSSLIPVTEIVVPFNMPLKEVLQQFRQGRRHQIRILDDKRGAKTVLDERECLNLYFERKFFYQPIGKLIH